MTDLDLAKLNRKMAEKVMGWISGISKEYPYPQQGGMVWMDSTGSEVIYQYLWTPTTDIVQTFQVVERMRKLGWHFGMDDYEISGNYEAEFVGNENNKFPSRTGRADDPALAICLAAEKAVEAGIEEPT